MAMKVADARDVEGRLEHDEDEQACYVPLWAGGPRTRVYRASEVPDLDDDWIWTGRLQTGHVTALVGPKGAGKSFLIAEIAARLSNGDPWPDDPLTPCEMAETLIITGEDEIPTVIKRRLRKCNADLENVHVVDFRDEDGTPGVITAEVVEEMADSLHGLKLIVIDPIDDFLGTRNGAAGSESFGSCSTSARGWRPGRGSPSSSLTPPTRSARARSGSMGSISCRSSRSMHERSGRSRKIRPTTIGSSGSSSRALTCRPAQTGWRSASTGSSGRSNGIPSRSSSRRRISSP